MNVRFLGSGNFFTIDNYNSNVLIEENGQRLLIDAGMDIKRSLHEQKISPADVNALYITHVHGDHAGGFEYFAYSSYMNHFHNGTPKIKLFCAPEVLEQLIAMYSYVLSVFGPDQVTIFDYFDVQNLSVSKDKFIFEWQGIDFTCVDVPHIELSGQVYLWNYGLFIEPKDGCRILFTGDCGSSTNSWLFGFYDKADVIFHDCEFSLKPSGVHPNISHLNKLEDAIKSKMYLYHYADNTDVNDPRLKSFKGLVCKGQLFIF